mgnify:CR=1 FL=1
MTDAQRLQAIQIRMKSFMVHPLGISSHLYIQDVSWLLERITVLDAHLERFAKTLEEERKDNQELEIKMDQRIATLEAALRAARVTEHFDDEPLGETTCTCGAEQHNAAIDAALVGEQHKIPNAELPTLQDVQKIFEDTP